MHILSEFVGWSILAELFSRVGKTVTDWRRHERDWLGVAPVRGLLL